MAGPFAALQQPIQCSARATAGRSYTGVYRPFAEGARRSVTFRVCSPVRRSANVTRTLPPIDTRFSCSVSPRFQP